jgi:hypothetical protein
MRIEETNVLRLRRPLERAGVGKPDIVIVCSDCAKIEAMRAKANMPAEAVATMFRNRGWKVDARGKNAICGKCQMTKSTTGPSPAARKSLAKATRLLSEYFDEEAGAFRDGWSDDAIAKEVGLSESAVAEWREDSFGPLRVPPEMARLEAEMLKVQKKVQTDLDEVRELVSGISREFGEKIAALRLELDEATKGRKHAA